MVLLASPLCKGLIALAKTGRRLLIVGSPTALYFPMGK